MTEYGAARAASFLSEAGAAIAAGDVAPAARTIRPLPTRTEARDLMLAERVAEIPGATLEEVKAYTRPGGIKTYHLIIRHAGDVGCYRGTYWLDYEGFADLEMNATPAGMARYLWQKRYDLYAGWERVNADADLIDRYERDHGRALARLRRYAVDRMPAQPGATVDHTQAIREAEESAAYWGERLDRAVGERSVAYERVIAIVGPRPD